MKTQENSHQLNPSNESFQSWNKIASLYEDAFMDLNIYDDTYNYLLSKFSNIEKPEILEIGCGPGNIARYLIEKRSDLNYLGIDVAPNMIALAKKNVPEARFKVMKAQQLAAVKGRFRAVVCGFILPYIQPVDLNNFLKNINNILYGEGHLYVSFVAGDPDSSGFQTGSSGDRIYFNYYERDVLIEASKNAGFVYDRSFEKTYKKSNGDSEIHTILFFIKD